MEFVFAISLLVIAIFFYKWGKSQERTNLLSLYIEHLEEHKKNQEWCEFCKIDKEIETK